MKRKTNDKNKIIGCVGLVISIALLVFHTPIKLFLINFSEKFLSADQHIEIPTIQLVETYSYFLILFLFIFSTILTSNLYRNLFQFTSRYIDWIKVKRFFLTDDICSKKQLPGFLIVVSIVLGLFMQSYLLLFYDPTPEGIIEVFSTSLLLVAGLILIISITQIKKNLVTPKLKKKIVFFLILCTGFSLFLFGEEISWGQVYFNWNSFGLFSEYNYQEETNSHNFFNPLFRFIYPIVGLSTFVVLFFVWFFPMERSYFLKLFIPPTSFFFIVFLMACSTFEGHSEIYEGLLAIFLLMYSVRVFACLRFQDENSVQTQTQESSIFEETQHHLGKVV